MKNILLYTALVCSAGIKSQITLENTYSTVGFISSIELSTSGYKYALVDAPNGVVKLYNTNHSLWKTMNMPKPAGAIFYYTASAISEGLFNTDSKVEFVYSYYATNTPSTGMINFTTTVIQEDGTVLLNTPGRYPYIQKHGSAYKLLIQVDTANKMAAKETQVYSLPGSMPVITSMAKKADENFDQLASPVPNPSAGKAIIPYSLSSPTADITFYDVNGKEVKKFTVDGTFNTLEVDNTDLPAGTYFYTVDGSETRKMAIIK